MRSLTVICATAAPILLGVAPLAHQVDDVLPRVGRLAVQTPAVRAVDEQTLREYFTAIRDWLAKRLKAP